MNAMSVSATNFVEENADGSDSEAEEIPDYYQPISAIGDDVEDEDSNNDQLSSDGDHEDPTSSFHRLPNGYTRQAENGISSLDLNGEVGEQNVVVEEEEERMREALESAALRAFREDENRRNAPLPPENAIRVMEAMRGISFGGMPPDWAGQVPEDRWIDQLRRIRQPPNTSIQH